jgi:RNA polymerase sigma factor for flagellar operon FliA
LKKWYFNSSLNEQDNPMPAAPLFDQLPNLPTLSVAEEKHYIQAYLPLVKRVVRQLSSQCNSVLDREDMEQFALMGLLDALRRYGVPDECFSGYAVHRIRGTVLDELRKIDWRPRRLRQRTHQMNDAIRTLTKSLGREPTFDDLSSALNISAQEYQDYLLLESAKSLVSLDEYFSFESNYAPGLESETLEANFISQQVLADILNLLEEREKMIVAMYYQHELSMKEIALVLNITEARVCQINKKIVDKIKQHILQGNI